MKRIGEFPQKEEVLELLKTTEKSLVCKLGVDPTATEVTLGWAVVLRELKRLQVCGHSITLIIGDFTAGIGDPTGKSKTRVPLTPQQINDNVSALLPQIFTILDPAKTSVKFNSDWLARKSFAEMMRIMANITVQQALNRNDFQNRLEDNAPVGLHEIMYPVCQALDSVHIWADIEIGGEDQLFNVMMGRDLMKQMGMKPQLPLLFPLLLGVDGTHKMSQSLGNFISIRDTPEDMFGKTMSIPDSAMPNWFHLLTDISFESAQKENPRDTKLILAEEIVRQFHGFEAATLAKINFINRFTHKIVMPTEILGFSREDANESWMTILEAALPGESKNNLKRLVQHKGVRLNGTPIESVKDFPEEGILTIGKLRAWKVESYD